MAFSRSLHNLVAALERHEIGLAELAVERRDRLRQSSKLLARLQQLLDPTRPVMNTRFESRNEGLESWLVFCFIDVVDADIESFRSLGEKGLCVPVLILT